MSLESRDLLRPTEQLPQTNYRFFVGGNDLEMQEIKRILTEKGTTAVDNQLGWGAKASAYSEQIIETIKKGEIPILIELYQDIKLPKDANVIIIDHHGKRSSEPASILQICKLLNTEPTRRIELIAANDAGWIPKLRAIGATDEEVRAIRAEDRKAQGFHEELEKQSEALAKSAQIIPELGLAVADNLSITRFAGIKDRIALEKGIYNIISIAKPQQKGQNGEMEFQGDGQICKELNKQFQGWSGGDGLGQKGGVAFWGGYPDNPNEIADYIKNLLQRPKPKYDIENAKRDFVNLSSDVSQEDIRKIVAQLKPRDQVDFFYTLIVNPISTFRKIRTLGKSGRGAIIRNAPIAAEIIVTMQEKRDTPFEAVTKDVTENLPSSLVNNDVLADLRGLEVPGIAEIKHDDDIKAFSNMLHRIDGLKQLLLFRGMIVGNEETKGVQSTFEGKDTGRYGTIGTGRFWYSLRVPVGNEIVSFKLGTEEPTNMEYKENPEIWLSAIEKTCNELTPERINETLAKTVGPLEKQTHSQAVGTAARERITLLQNLAEKAKANVPQYAQLLQKNKEIFGSPKAVQDWETEKAEFVELMETIGSRFKDAHIISNAQGNEKVVGSGYVRDYDDQVVLGWFKKYEESTYPSWFIDRMNHSGTKYHISYGGYTPNGLVNLREIELDLLEIPVTKK